MKITIEGTLLLNQWFWRYRCHMAYIVSTVLGYLFVKLGVE